MYKDEFPNTELGISPDKLPAVNVEEVLKILKKDIDVVPNIALELFVHCQTVPPLDVP